MQALKFQPLIVPIINTDQEKNNGKDNPKYRKNTCAHENLNITFDERIYFAIQR